MAIDKRWFTDRLADKQLSQRKLAKLLELDPSAITHILNGKRKLQLDEAQRMSRYIGVPVEEILTHAGIRLKQSGAVTCPLIGTVDAHGVVKNVSGLQVEAPSNTMAALQVQAGLSSFDGMLLYFDPDQVHAPDLLVGKMAVIFQPDGQRVGILRRGLTVGRYTINIGTEEIHDEPATGASPVLWIKP